MNELIKELATRSKMDREMWPDIAREPVWIATDEELDEFAQMIVKECIDNIEVWEKDSRNHISYMLKQHFESGNPVEGSNGLHTCPYAEEIHGDYETLCDCDEEQQYQCRMDI